MRVARVESPPDVAKKDRQYVFRLDTELADRVDAYIAKLRDDTGVEIAQSAVIRKLLVLGLDAAEKSEKKPRSGRS